MSRRPDITNNTDYEWLLSRSKTAYEFLSLEKSNLITNSKLRKSYRNKALELHPDKNQSSNAEDEFREVAVSYKILSDPNLKLKYDEFLERQVSILAQKQLRTSQQQQLKDDLLTAEDNVRILHKNNININRKIEILRKQYSKMKRDKIKSIKNSHNKLSKTSFSHKDNHFSFPSEVRLKWKNKTALETSITSDVLAQLMNVFGDINRVQISKNNKSSDNYHYATIFYKSHLSCIIAELHDYSKPSSLWDEAGLTRLSRLLRYSKIIKYDDKFLNSLEADNSNMDFEKYLGISLLKLRKTLCDERYR